MVHVFKQKAILFMASSFSYYPFLHWKRSLPYTLKETDTLLLLTLTNTTRDRKLHHFFTTLWFFPTSSITLSIHIQKHQNILEEAWGKIVSNNPN